MNHKTDLQIDENLGFNLLELIKLHQVRDTIKTFVNWDSTNQFTWFSVNLLTSCQITHTGTYLGPIRAANPCE